jgi:hypothetical protein
MVSIRWTTHNPAGLGEKDVEMAETCERLAWEHGVKVEEETKAADSAEESIGACTLDAITAEGCRACSTGGNAEND